MLKEKIFFKFLDGKVVFMLKVYGLLITNVDLLAKSSNHEVMFPEYLRNIPQMSVSKIFQGYPLNSVRKNAPSKKFPRKKAGKKIGAPEN